MLQTHDNDPLERRKKREERINSAIARKMNSAGEGFITKPCLRVIRTKTGAVQCRFTTATATAGLWEAITSGIPVSSIPLRNALPVDPETGKQEEVPAYVWLALLGAGMATFASSRGGHLVPLALMGLVNSIFSKMPDAASYFRGLLSPAQGNGILKGVEVRLDTVWATYPDGTVGPAGADGRGWIHPKHPAYAQLGISSDNSCPVQIRVVSSGLRESIATMVGMMALFNWKEAAKVFSKITSGVSFWKGTLDPDERAVDEDGNPSIVLDWLQCKGNFKGLSKDRRTQGAARLLTVDIAITKTFDRLGACSLCFEFFERIADTVRTRELVKKLMCESMEAFKLAGGPDSIVNRISEDNRMVRLIVELCKRVKVNPLCVPYVKNLVTEHMREWKWFMGQGAGIKCPYIKASILNSVPEGHFLMVPPRGKNGHKLFKHGDKMVVSRYPGVLSQGIIVGIVIDPESESFLEDYPWLEEVLVSRYGLKTLPDNIMYLNERDLVLRMQGDDDGDELWFSSDSRLIELAENRSFIFKKGEIILIEPEALEDNPRSNTPLASWQGLVNVNRDFQGPIGYLTNLMSCSIDKGKRGVMAALALAVQVAIDSGKKVMVVPSLVHAMIIGNWEEVVRTDQMGEYKAWVLPSDSRKYPARSGILDPVTGCYRSKWLRTWANTEVLGGTRKKRVALADVITWRKLRGTDNFTEGPEPGKGNGTLVTYMFEVLSGLLKEHEALMSMDVGDSVDLVDLLPLALGRTVAPVERGSDEYWAMINKAGLTDYNKSVVSILKLGLNPDERNEQIEAQQVLLANQLNSPEVDNLQVWVSCLTGLQSCDGDYDRCLNWAMFAVAFSGSPILNELGILEEGTCSFLQDRFQEIEDWIGSVYHGPSGAEGRTVGHAATTFLFDNELNEAHEEEFEVPMHKCRWCKEHVRAVATAMMRGNPDPSLAVFAKDLVSRVNAILAVLETYPCTEDELKQRLNGKFYAKKLSGVPRSAQWVSLVMKELDSIR